MRCYSDGIPKYKYTHTINSHFSVSLFSSSLSPRITSHRWGSVVLVAVEWRSFDFLSFSLCVSPSSSPPLLLLLFEYDSTSSNDCNAPSFFASSSSCNISINRSVCVWNTIQYTRTHTSTHTQILRCIQQQPKRALWPFVLNCMLNDKHASMVRLKKEEKEAERRSKWVKSDLA